MVNYQMKTSEKSLNLTKVRKGIFHGGESKNLPLQWQYLCAPKSERPLP